MFNAFGNATQVPAANWRDEPATRGTWNILSTCLITLGLCLWTALHVNIPGRREGAWRPKLRKTSWLLLGLLAPEMFAYTAWFQRRAAHKLTAVMRRKLRQDRGRSRTRTQRLAVFFACCCRHRKQVAGSETSDVDVELDDREVTATIVEHDASSGSRSRSRAAGHRHRWTTTHSFYALMGGFVFDTRDADINFLPNSRERLTLTPTGLSYLLEHEPDLVPNLSEEHIRDKSKASNLAKTIVCLQALWFCVQCIVRLAQGLAISLLELNVFGHAICALLMYFLWWDKPLDIEEPTVLSGNMAPEMCALMCMRSSPDVDGWRGLPELPNGVRYGSEFTRNIAETSIRPGEDTSWSKWSRLVAKEIDHWHDIMLALSRKPRRGRPTPLECRLDWTGTESLDAQPERFDIGYPIDLDYPGDAAGSKDQTASPVLPPAPAVATDNGLCAEDAGMRSTQPLQPLPPGLSIDGFSLTLGKWQWKENPGGTSYVNAIRFVPRQPQPDYAPAFVTLTHVDIIRWRLCARAIQRYCPQPQWIFISGAPSHQDFPAYRSVCERAPNWPSSQRPEFTKEDSGEWLGIWLGFSFAGLVYGGLHLLAWDAPFPSRVEGKLWRSSGVLLASSGFIGALFLLAVASILLGHNRIISTAFWQDLKTRLGHRYKSVAGLVDMAVRLIGGIPALAFAAAYVAARVYLVVESFLQLVHLPDSAYNLPGWSQYYPHIT